ncbi:MAG: hypothetical protein M1818_000144 [Claussenomyces sp. TS43310]|nr:MAG: hypothetical protein M1818_000144 [Claussenomyces sp. TS43310]
MPVVAPDERRRARTIVFGALITLFLLYFVKFTFPQHTIRNVINAQSSVLSSVADVSLPPQMNAQPLADVSSSADSRFPEATRIPDLVRPTNGSIVDRVAIIIEDRPNTNLIPLILHFGTVLGPSWPLIIYTSQENVASFASSAALSRHLRTGAIAIRTLPSTVLFTNSDSVSRFLTQSWIWEDLAPAKHVLLFQSDSMLCANAVRSVEDFFTYDFVGAPIASHLGKGMNGGLSLRKRETLLRILEEWNWETDKGSRFEDRWYYDR